MKHLVRFSQENKRIEHGSSGRFVFEVRNSIDESGFCEVLPVDEKEILQQQIHAELCQSETSQELHGLDFEVSENTTLNNAIWELSRNSGPKVNINFDEDPSRFRENGLVNRFLGNPQRESAPSYSFLRHPEFEAHFQTLQEHWGEMPPQTPERKSFEIIAQAKADAEYWQARRAEIEPLDWKAKLEKMQEILQAAQAAAQAEVADAGASVPQVDFRGKDIDYWLENPGKFSGADINYFFEIFFRPQEISFARDGKNTLFTMGYTHNAVYQHLHSERYGAKLAPQADLIGIETFANQFGSSLELKFNSFMGFAYNPMMRDQVAANPELMFFEADRRDPIDGFFDTDDLENSAFIEAKWEFLRNLRPQWASETIGSPETLGQIMRHYQLGKRLEQPFKYNDELGSFFQLPHWGKDEAGGLMSQAKPSGLEMEQMEWSDALHTQLLLELSHSLNAGQDFPAQIDKLMRKKPDFAAKIHSLSQTGAVIVDIQGSFHNLGKARYEADPAARLAQMAMHPEYLGTAGDMMPIFQGLFEKITIGSIILSPSETSRLGENKLLQPAYYQERFNTMLATGMDFNQHPKTQLQVFWPSKN